MKENLFSFKKQYQHASVPEDSGYENSLRLPKFGLTGTVSDQVNYHGGDRCTT
ncbi:MAG TPA: hypothetical protein VIU12_32205 [Chryseolinea sp.]